MALWMIKRWVLEEYEEEAETRKQALAKCDDPFRVTVTKTTCVKAMESEESNASLTLSGECSEPE